MVTKTKIATSARDTALSQMKTRRLGAVRFVAIDTETKLIRPGKQFPEMVCLTIADERTEEIEIYKHNECEPRLVRLLEDPKVRLVAHKSGFDTGVICAYNPDLLPLFVKKYDDNRFTCTLIRQWLLDIYDGNLRYEEIEEDVYEERGYTLDEIILRYFNHVMDKSTWRLRYGELMDVPLQEWLPGQVDYAKEDAAWCLRLAQKQEELGKVGRCTKLDDEYNEARKWCAAAFEQAWGLKTKKEGLEKLEATLENQIGELTDKLKSTGWIREDGSRNMNAVRERMVSLCNSQGRAIPRTKTYKKNKKKNSQWEPKKPLDGVAIGYEACKDKDDELLKAYALLTRNLSIRNKDLPIIRSGVDFPIHPGLSMADTGRFIAFAPNTLNFGRLEGVRECFVARPRHVILDGDYNMLEVYCLADVCDFYFKQSELKERLLKGDDIHIRIGGYFFKHSDRVIDQFVADWKGGIKPKEVKTARTFGKIANFGIPGGLSASSAVDYAHNDPYNLTLTTGETQSLIDIYFHANPTVKRLMKELPGSFHQDGKHWVQLPWSKRWRGRCTKTEAANFYFQGTGIDVVGYALWLLFKACYLDRNSPLFGCRIINCVHDQFLIECLEENIDPAAREMRRLMREGALIVTPRCSTDTEIVAVRYWRKEADPTYVDGKLVVTEGKYYD